MRRSYIVLLVGLVLILSVSLQAQTIQSGTFNVGKSTSGFNLDKGDGERTVNVEVKFKKPFESTPTIMVSVNRVDAAKDTNLRYAVTTSFVSTEGFLIKVVTWGDTQIHGIGGQWIAIASE